MTLAHAMTLRQARDHYLAEAGFSTDTYVEDWVDIPFGPLPLRLPSTDARKRVLPVHDIHHALTGYRSDLMGEAEIGAWELGGGLGPHTVGYVLDLLTLSWSPLLGARRVFRAFVRGRHTKNYYRAALPLPQSLLDRDVDEVRRELGLDRELPAAKASDVAAFIGWYLASLLMAVVGLAGLPVLVALGLWGRWQARRASTGARPQAHASVV
ncbi:hypothetical protein [Paraliomyxa miuraensis]|uniref:hypothetical protein n=1 Tax=Paraliomyxa miuraensis TaxID=376150 RepID=UPI0022573E6A|nr:hypothetical protein [Paraliomyxa miuraensis]MCX4243719.1 hypothetical protein [Paraliomyxa miuraensis]